MNTDDGAWVEHSAPEISAQMHAVAAALKNVLGVLQFIIISTEMYLRGASRGDAVSIDLVVLKKAPSNVDVLD